MKTKHVFENIRGGISPTLKKLAMVWAKLFKIWEQYTATFTCK